MRAWSRLVVAVCGLVVASMVGGCAVEADTVSPDVRATSIPVATATPRPVPATPAPEPTSTADRLLSLVAGLEREGFVIEAGAEGDRERFEALVVLAETDEVPWYFLSIVGEPAADFADDIRDVIGSPSNVLVYWSEEDWVGIQLASGASDADEDRALEPFDGDWSTPDELMGEVRFLLAPAVQASQNLAAAIEIAKPYPNVEVELIGEVIVLTGTVTTPADRAEIDRKMQEAEIPFSNQVRVGGPEDRLLVEHIDAQPELSTFRSLISEAELSTELLVGGDVNLIVPTNDALAPLAASLDELRLDQPALQAFVLSHAVPGKTPLVDRSNSSHPTFADGVEVEVELLDFDQVRFNGVATVLIDAPASNGHLYIVDAPVVAVPG